MTVTTPDAATPGVPPWPHCGQGATSDEPVGCRGRQVEPYAECLAHLSGTDRSAYLAGLQPGADLDHRGTRFSEALLSELLGALVNSATNRPHLGNVRFDEVDFDGRAEFNEATFDGVADFKSAVFHSIASFHLAKFNGLTRFDRATFDVAWFIGAAFNGVEFDGATFSLAARFDGAKFGREVRFDTATFNSKARFNHATFSGNANFLRVRVHRDAEFCGVTFSRDVRLDSAKFGSDVDFAGAVLERASQVGPLVCSGTLDFTEVSFGSAVTIEVAARRLQCRRTRWASTAALRMRYAAVDLSDAVMEYPVSVSAHPHLFLIVGNRELQEFDLGDPRVRVVSLRGVDAAHLTLTDVDLTHCFFAGTIHLDQLRLEGRCPLALAPPGMRRHGRWPVRWTRRLTLAEEHHWRASRSTAGGGWTPAPAGAEVLQPAALAPVYRQLRKAFEDGKNEPGAADFYYGEMEMRRHTDDIPWAERRLLDLYWAVSGYGLRALRALGWLLAAMTATVVAMMLWGLPKDDPKAESTGTVDGLHIVMTTDTPDPVNPDGRYSERLSTERFEKSLRVVINSVVFRSSGQELTTAGTYIEMLSRIGEPVLLGLAVLAVRGRVKR
ncbi:metal transporter [Streptomyces sp. NRRL F-4707]|nr:metal transporter [Streptomyces sp. NRRL F-4707]